MLHSTPQYSTVLQYFTVLHSTTVLHSAPQYSTVLQYFTVLHNTTVHRSTPQYSTVLHSTPQYFTVLHSTPQYSTVLQYFTVLHSTPQYSTVLHSTPQYFTVLHSTPQYYSTPQYTSQYSTVFLMHQLNVLQLLPLLLLLFNSVSTSWLVQKSKLSNKVFSLQTNRTRFSLIQTQNSSSGRTWCIGLDRSDISVWTRCEREQVQISVLPRVQPVRFWSEWLLSTRRRLRSELQSTSARL